MPQVIKPSLIQFLKRLNLSKTYSQPGGPRTGNSEEGRLPVPNGDELELAGGRVIVFAFILSDDVGTETPGRGGEITSEFLLAF